MEVNTTTVDMVTVVSMSGDLDARTAPIAHARFQSLLPLDGPVLLDLTEVLYVSSAGLRVMLMVYRLMQTTGHSVALTGLSPQLHRALSATGFLRFFHVLDSVREGLLFLQPTTRSR